MAAKEEHHHPQKRMAKVVVKSSGNLGLGACLFRRGRVTKVLGRESLLLESPLCHNGMTFPLMPLQLLVSPHTPSNALVKKSLILYQFDFHTPYVVFRVYSKFFIFGLKGVFKTVVSPGYFPVL